MCIYCKDNEEMKFQKLHCYTYFLSYFETRPQTSIVEIENDMVWSDEPIPNGTDLVVRTRITFEVVK